MQAGGHGHLPYDRVFSGSSQLTVFEIYLIPSRTMVLSYVAAYRPSVYRFTRVRRKHTFCDEFPRYFSPQPEGPAQRTYWVRKYLVTTLRWTQRSAHSVHLPPYQETRLGNSFEGVRYLKYHTCYIVCLLQSRVGKTVE